MDYVIRPATEDDAPEIVALINSQEPEPLTVDEYLRFDRLRPKEAPSLRIVAVAPEGTLLGMGFTSHEDSHHPPGFFTMRVRVAADFQRHGIGQALYRQLEAYALEHGAERIGGSVREINADALAWAQRRAFGVQHHTYDSALDLTRWDPAPWDEPIAQVEAGGIRFTTLAEEGEHEANLRRCHALFNELVPDVPGLADMPEFPYELWYEHISRDKAWNPAHVFLAADGDRWIGITHVVARPTGGLHTNFTGVSRAYRGRGVALALKLVALRYAKQAGYPYVRTDNHSTNVPMLAVNRRLGFVPEPGHFHLERHVGAS